MPCAPRISPGLERYVVERSQREEGIFLPALEEAATGLARSEDVDARFVSLFVRMPDGTLRNRPEHFDGTRMPGVFVPAHLLLNAELRQRILASYDVLAQYGPISSATPSPPWRPSPRKSAV